MRLCRILKKYKVYNNIKVYIKYNRYIAKRQCFLNLEAPPFGLAIPDEKMVDQIGAERLRGRFISSGSNTQVAESRLSARDMA